MTDWDADPDKTRDRWIGPRWLQDLFDRLYRTAPISYGRRRSGFSRLVGRARHESGYAPRDGSISDEQWWDERAQDRSRIAGESAGVPLDADATVDDRAKDATADDRAAAAAKLEETYAIERAKRLERKE